MEILKVIGVRFKKAGKIFYFDPADDVIEKGDFVIVDTMRGLECGEVVIGERDIPEAEIPAQCSKFSPIRRIHRKATKADLARVAENKEHELKAFDICKEKIAEHGLPMKLINVNYTFDVNKIIFYFTADGRVDFRELVRDLAYIFHTRIELRQVGVRDDAKQLGGVGCCGRPLCCANFLGDFAPVSIRMAKEQNLSLNPTKISGICGRLLCCLKFESEYYHEKYMENFQAFQPERGDRVILSEGMGRVVSVNYQTKMATVVLENKRTITAVWEDILPVDVKDNPNRNISEEKTETPAEVEEISAVEDLAEVVESEEEIVAAVEEAPPEEKLQPTEFLPSKREEKRNTHYSRKNNYNKKSRNNGDGEFPDIREIRKQAYREKSFKSSKSRRPRKGGDYRR